MRQGSPAAVITWMAGYEEGGWGECYEGMRKIIKSAEAKGLSPSHNVRGKTLIKKKTENINSTSIVFPVAKSNCRKRDISERGVVKKRLHTETYLGWMCRVGNLQVCKLLLGSDLSNWLLRWQCMWNRTQV